MIHYEYPTIVQYIDIISNRGYDTVRLCPLNMNYCDFLTFFFYTKIDKCDYYFEIKNYGGFMHNNVQLWLDPAEGECNTVLNTVRSTVYRYCSSVQTVGRRSVSSFIIGHLFNVIIFRNRTSTH